MPFNRLNHSILGEIRPRFYLKTDSSEEDCLVHLEKKMRMDTTVMGERSKDLVFLKTPLHIQHYWSPEMTVRISQNEEERFTQISCLITSVRLFKLLLRSCLRGVKTPINSEIRHFSNRNIDIFRCEKWMKIAVYR